MFAQILARGFLYDLVGSRVEFRNDILRDLLVYITGGLYRESTNVHEDNNDSKAGNKTGTTKTQECDDGMRCMGQK